MSDPFLDDEASVQDGEAREFYDIAIGTTTYYLTSASRNLVMGAQVYTKEAINRSKIEVAQLRSGNQSALTVRLRINHPIVRRWFQQGVPPKSTSVIVWRKQMRSGLVERIWTGTIASIDAESNPNGATIAAITVTSLLGPPFRRRLPTFTAGRQCSNVLYGPGCNLVRTALSPSEGIPYKCSTTVTYVNGREVRFDLSSVPVDANYRAQWLRFGELVHVSSGERMTILDQADTNPGVSTVTVVTMRMQIVGMKVGDAIEAYAGCTHDIATCYEKFSNQVNYGGLPSLPTKNPFFPTGLGVMEQT